MIFFDRADDRWKAHRRVVDVHHRNGLQRSQWTFGRSIVVCVRNFDADLSIHIGITQRVRAGGGSADGNAVAQPLIAECAQSVDVADAAGVGGQSLIFFHRARDGRQTDGSVVHRRDINADRSQRDQAASTTADVAVVGDADRNAVGRNAMSIR